jgi:cellulose synthase/poly-beta-1,6-N-acetylglucosamine synthase-like glycosyltransferase
LLSWYEFRSLEKKAKNVQQNFPTSKPASPERVSIIIAVKNEARYIGKTIRNLESTTFNKSKVEIILIDSGCSDNTVEVAKVQYVLAIYSYSCL